MTIINNFVIILDVGDKMNYTVTYLKQHQSEGINLEMDFSKEINGLPEIVKIDSCTVTGNYTFLNDSIIEFHLLAKADVTFQAADTLNLIKRTVEVLINDEVSDDSEYKIVNDKINLYELVWGWFISEVPLTVYEKEEEENGSTI